MDQEDNQKEAIDEFIEIVDELIDDLCSWAVGFRNKIRARAEEKIGEIVEEINKEE